MKGKEKALPVPFNNYSADRIANAGKKRKEYEDMGLVEPRTVPLTKKQCLGHEPAIVVPSSVVCNQSPSIAFDSSTDALVLGLCSRYWSQFLVNQTKQGQHFS